MHIQLSIYLPICLHNKTIHTKNQ